MQQRDKNRCACKSGVKIVGQTPTQRLDFSSGIIKEIKTDEQKSRITGE
jgi:hypothetical protein